MRYFIRWVGLASIFVALSSNAGAVPSAAFATIDWSSLDVNVFGEGALVPIDDPFISNHAVMTNEDLVPWSAQHNLFAPAFAGHPFYAETAGVAGFADDASSAAAHALIGSASAASNASINFAAFGAGSALITVGYALGAGIGGEWPWGGAASSGVELGLSVVDFQGGHIDGLLHDGVDLHRAANAGASADTGYLALLFAFEVGEYGILRLDGSAWSTAIGVLAEPSAAVGTLAAPVPVPAALPLMLSALGLVGVCARRNIRT